LSSGCGWWNCSRWRFSWARWQSRRDWFTRLQRLRGTCRGCACCENHCRRRFCNWSDGAARGNLSWNCCLRALSGRLHTGRRSHGSDCCWLCCYNGGLLQALSRGSNSRYGDERRWCGWTGSRFVCNSDCELWPIRLAKRSFKNLRMKTSGRRQEERSHQRQHLVKVLALETG